MNGILHWLKKYAAVIAIAQAIIFPVTTFTGYYYMFTQQDDIFMFEPDAISYHVLSTWHFNEQAFGFTSMDECMEHNPFVHYTSESCTEYLDLQTNLEIITEAYELYEIPYTELDIDMIFTIIYPLGEVPTGLEEELKGRIKP